jgi:hypothetical protein
MAEAHMPVTAHQVEKLRDQLAFLLRDGQHYRTVPTDSESSDGVMLVCTSPEHPADDQLAQWGVYDCCDLDVFMELHHEKRAAFFVSATIAIPALLAEREQLAARIAELETELREVLSADGSVE